MRKLFFILFIFIIPFSLFSDGFIVIPNPTISNNPFPLEVKYHHVDVQINEQTSTTFIDQEFYNPNNRILEGYYLFPIPKGAVIKKFSMFINGKEMPAELLDAAKAKKIYEDIVRQQLDPALLEYSGQSLFKVRIFPIEPNSTKRIKISYTEILNKDNGTYEYVYPLNTEKFSSKPLDDVYINIHIKSKDQLKNIYCSTHDVDVVRKNENYSIVSYEERNVKPDKDFILYYNTDKSKIGLTLLTYKEKANDGYFFISASPGFAENEEIIEKDITFVLDTSGSMDGEKLDQAKKALKFCINNLNKNDRFDIIRFSTEAESIFNNLVYANNENIKTAKNEINDFKAIGGTNIDEALTLALLNTKENMRPHFIIFITDGKPTIGEINDDRLIKKISKNNSKNTRIFTFGIGYELNTHLLDKITELSKAYRTYISPKEDIEVKISNFYNKIQSPILTDIKLMYDNGLKLTKIYPKNLPDLFKGSSITILGRYKNAKNKTKLILQGKVNNKVKEFVYTVNFDDNNTKNDFIPPLWAARRIGYLLDQIRLSGESKEVIDEITILARKHGIVTPYTSYLILEDEIDRVNRNDLDEGDQTLANIIPESKKEMEEYRGNFYSMKRKFGKDSIEASEDVRDLNNATNYKQIIQGKNEYKDDKGNTKNIANQVRNMQGRAFYNSGNQWIDSKIQETKYNKTIKIKFASKKYFELLNNEPLAQDFLSLGKNVRFVMNNNLYEIYE